MSGCLKCWETPCACGYEYRNWSQKRKLELVSVILNIPPDQISTELNLNKSTLTEKIKINESNEAKIQWFDKTAKWVENFDDIDDLDDVPHEAAYDLFDDFIQKRKELMEHKNGS